MNCWILKRRLINLIFIFFMYGSVSAAEETGIYFQPEKITLQPGTETTITLLVANASPVYGVELEFSFDPNIVEVTADADKKKNEVQLVDGNFLAHKKTLTLQNQADNTAGTIGYVKTLLNPAPPAQGNGELLQITLKGKQIGKADFRITKAKFGTQKGTVIIPNYQPEVNILVSDSIIDSIDRKIVLVIAVVVLLLIAGLTALVRKRTNF